MSLLIVGSIALDTVHTPYGKVEDAVGGSAVYGAYAASRFTPVSIVGVVGDDFPARELRSLRRCGVDLEGLERVKKGKTFRWGGRYFEDINQRETLYTELNVFSDFAPKLPDSYRRIPNVFLANIDPDLQLDVLRQVAKPRLVVCDTMNLWIDIKRPSLLRLLKKIDCLLLNDEEARMLGDSASLTRAALKLRRRGIERIVVKKGEHGCTMFGPEGVFGAPALPLAAVKDPTGAGDTFAGGMLGYLCGRALSEANWRKAIVAGTALASFCVEDFSTRRLRRLDPKTLARRCDEVRAMMQVGNV
ncbi:sugar kinase [Candidatus Sumerlaeota bacterium]|nr:sugar kinase [Candidatus Sumerlaeota bacterium]